MRNISQHRGKSRKGSVMLEFGIVMSVLIPLLFGTVAFGVNLGNMLQSTQISRDIAHMYARGVDFSTDPNKAIAVKLVQGLGGMTATGGDGKITLSTVRMVSAADCAPVILPVGTPATNANCPNLDKRVFTNRLVIGKSSLPGSRFGDPTGTCVVSATDGNISPNDYLRQASCRPTGFDNSVLPQAAGEVAYMVEAYFATADLSSFGSGGTGSYTRAIF